MLYSGERLAAAARRRVRGYRETLLLADKGVIGSVELAQPFNLSGGAAPPAPSTGARSPSPSSPTPRIAANAEDPQPIPDQIASIGLSLEWHPPRGPVAHPRLWHALEDARQTGERDLQDRGVHFRFIFRPLQLD